MTSMAPVPTTLSVLELAEAGHFDEIRDLFAPQLRAMVTGEALREAWSAALGRCGPVRSLGSPVSEPAHAGVVAVKVPVHCEHTVLTLIASVTEDGWLAGLRLAPPEAARPAAAWEPPKYADAKAFDEVEVRLGDDPVAVDGTLTLPRQSGRHPAVVLLAGSGPQDRDETIGPNRPFKDLAWGLAGRGVAVLRFDKVTFAHPAEVSGSPDFTMADEYLPQAIAAVELLARHDAVDPRRIFVLGHSLGGTVAPRIVAAQPSIAGLIILAGGTEPMHRAAVRQMRHIASLNPESAHASDPVIMAMTAQAQAVDDPGLSPATPAQTLPFGVPAPYWLDVRSYDPVAVAATLNVPMLILQGGRDYQVTIEDDLARWEAGLDGRTGVTIRVYPADNHLFVPGSGPSGPADYDVPDHVDPAVVADIAGWLATVRG
jgi:uncharacterized protein